MANPQRPRFFNFDAQAVRVVGNEFEPWFIAKDVCDALGIGNSRKALSSLETDEKDVTISDTLGGPQEFSTVNESGLYALIFRSRKPQARLFRRWVTGEVLPAIRRTGRYAPISRTPVGQLPANYDLASKHLARLAALVLAGGTYAVVTARELLPICRRENLLFWVVNDRPGDNSQVALGVLLKRMLGWTLLLPGGGTASLEAIGRNRHRRYLVIRQTEVHHA